MTDEGYDGQSNRAAAQARGITPVIPRRENSKQRGRFFPKRLYKPRTRIEQTIGKLKRFKRVAMRCEKTDISYSAFVSFACGLMLVKSVRTAQHFRVLPFALTQFCPTVPHGATQELYMDLITETTLDMVNADLQDVMEEALATRLLLGGLLRHLIANQTLHPNELAAIITDPLPGMHTPGTTEDVMFVDRMRNRLAVAAHFLGLSVPLARVQQ